MAAHASLVLSFGYLLLLLLLGCLSAPTTSYAPTRNLTTNELTPFSSPLSIDTLSLLNLLPSFPNTDIRYAVPNTRITLFFNLGFPLDELAMRDTIDAARNYCDLQIRRSGDEVPLPQTEDPFHDDLGYGAAIHVVSVRPRHRVTWGILRAVMQGLWDVLVVGRRFVEAEFQVFYATVGFVGRGSVTEAAKAPTLR